MPKREPTPPPADDEPKYLTVNYPYPLHANMEIPEERKTLARWIACVMDQKDFFALYHKPTAPNMVIIEVARDSKNMEKLLGAHKWSEILRDPTEEEKKFESRVFYCVFNKGRDVQKAGWKRIDISDSWFVGFSQKNKFIKYPYPPTHYCDLPAENQTGYRLCRMLPAALFPKPKVVVKPPPAGSEAWLRSKQESSTSSPTAARTIPGWVPAPTPVVPVKAKNARKGKGVQAGPGGKKMVIELPRTDSRASSSEDSNSPSVLASAPVSPWSPSEPRGANVSIVSGNGAKGAWAKGAPSPVSAPPPPASALSVVTSSSAASSPSSKNSKKNKKKGQNDKSPIVLSPSATPFSPTPLNAMAAPPPGLSPPLANPGTTDGEGGVDQEPSWGKVAGDTAIRPTPPQTTSGDEGGNEGEGKKYATWDDEVASAYDRERESQAGSVMGDWEDDDDVGDGRTVEDDDEEVQFVMGPNAGVAQPACAPAPAPAPSSTAAPKSVWGKPGGASSIKSATPAQTSAWAAPGAWGTTPSLKALAALAPPTPPLGKAGAGSTQTTPDVTNAMGSLSVVGGGGPYSYQDPYTYDDVDEFGLPDAKYTYDGGPGVGGDYYSAPASGYENGDGGGPVESLWSDPVESPDPNGGQPLCNAHGVVCKKGICAEYSKQLKKMQAEKDKEGGGGKGKGKGLGVSDGDGWAQAKNGKGKARGRQLSRGAKAAVTSASASTNNGNDSFSSNQSAPITTGGNAWAKPSHWDTASNAGSTAGSKRSASPWGNASVAGSVAGSVWGVKPEDGDRDGW